MRILSLSLVYPNPAEPGLGLFVRSRLQHVAQGAELKVIAPVPITDYSNPAGRRLRGRDVPFSREDGAVEVLHPRWAYPPAGTPLNVLCLAARLLPAVVALRRRFPFEVIDAHFGYPEGAVAALLGKMLGCPFMVTLRGSELVFARYRPRRACLRWTLRRAAAVVAVSEELRAFAVRHGAGPGRLAVIPNGIDRDVFRPRGREECRARWGIDPDARVILSAGELIEAKGHHLAVGAVKRIADAGRDVHLFIAGGVARGGARFDAEIRRLVADLGLETRVTLLGWRNPREMAELMCAADVFCLASYIEGWPNVVNEALACGTPVVASKVGAVPQMLPSETYGITVPPRDQAALTAALERALDRGWDRAAISAWGQSRSWQNVAAEVLSLLSSVIENRQGRAAAGSLSTPAGI